MGKTNLSLENSLLIFFWTFHTSILSNAYLIRTYYVENV